VAGISFTSTSIGHWDFEFVSDFVLRISCFPPGCGIYAPLAAREVEDAVTVRDVVLTLLRATAGRSPRLSCFGLHEWAMVYRQPAEEIRHATVPLRLGSSATDALVDALEIKCGHYDAFRFFTEAAKPANTLKPTRADQAAFEQPGCLHANMDLYKWAYKLGPLAPAELVADCFELAAQIRELDMRASPYDLSAFGYSPVRIETSEGRAHYAHQQAEFARRAAPLRASLIDLCADIVANYASSSQSRIG
jgi:hypothetical protein